MPLAFNKRENNFMITFWVSEHVLVINIHFMLILYTIHNEIIESPFNIMAISCSTIFIVVAKGKSHFHAGKIHYHEKIQLITHSYVKSLSTSINTEIPCFERDENFHSNPKMQLTKLRCTELLIFTMSCQGRLCDDACH